MNVSSITSDMHLHYAIILCHLFHSTFLSYFIENCKQELVFSLSTFVELPHILKEQ